VSRSNNACGAIPPLPNTHSWGGAKLKKKHRDNFACHLHLGLPGGVFPAGTLAKVSNAFVISLVGLVVVVIMIMITIIRVLRFYKKNSCTEDIAHNEASSTV